MEFTTVVLQVLGVVYLSFAAKAILNPQSLQAFIDGFVKNQTLMGIAGAITAATGMGILANYNTWSWDWNVIVTFVGWAMVIKGIAYIVMPTRFTDMFKSMWSSETGLISMTVVMMVAGFLCAYLGFLA